MNLSFAKGQVIKPGAFNRILQQGKGKPYQAVLNDVVLRSQAERLLGEMDLVHREEFEAVKDMARLAREENEALKARIVALEAKLGGAAAAPDHGSDETPGG